ncbi:hypothetical protein F5884DRAFT_178154 [Xylogone sp. PMI_703]|nr:hypothetical protein F5884DRAFT_178154 [Xylogone sp. PMI_703]
MEPSSDTPTFHLFSSLAPEIRIKIWAYVASVPRVIRLQYRMSSQKREKDGRTISNFVGWHSPDPVPAILSVSREARQEGLKHYQLAFGTMKFHAPKTYFNFEVDTLRVGAAPDARLSTDPKWFSGGPDGYVLNLLLDDTEKVNYLIIDVHEDLYGLRAFCWDEVRDFSRLVEVTLIPWEGDQPSVLLRYAQSSLKYVAENWPEWVLPKVKVKSSLDGEYLGEVNLEK